MDLRLARQSAIFAHIIYYGEYISVAYNTIIYVYDFLLIDNLRASKTGYKFASGFFARCFLATDINRSIEMKIE